MIFVFMKLRALFAGYARFMQHTMLKEGGCDATQSLLFTCATAADTENFLNMAVR
jgi:hypothetical protein